MSWYRRWRRDFFSIFDEMERTMERMFREMHRTYGLPKEPTYREKLPGGGEIQRWGPYVYGYSITVGPDGEPVIREFGNVKPGIRGPTLKEEREPLVDVIEETDKVRLVAELPGVNKEDIDVKATEREVTIKVDTPTRKYSRKVKLPCEVKSEATKARYTNGVLELAFERKEKKPRGKSIRVE
ncbi:MAG: archaeal heat shock protein Hsp20 [Candidatus Bathyarchaeia archaeon]